MRKVRHWWCYQEENGTNGNVSQVRRTAMCEGSTIGPLDGTAESFCGIEQMTPRVTLVASEADPRYGLEAKEIRSHDKW
jgi:hypothetical protein